MPTSRPRGTRCQVNGFSQVLGLMRIFQVLKSCKPFLLRRVGSTAVIGSCDTMHASVFVRWKQRMRVFAHLPVNVIDPAIELHKRSLHQLVSRTTPVLLQL